MIWNLPNILTLSRFVIAALFLYYAVHEDWRIALWLFASGALTDMIDGTIARLFKQKTAMGAFLDPMADKILMFSGFMILAFKGGMPVWLTGLVVLRDLMITFGILFFYLRGTAIPYEPTWLSKVTTLSQILTLSLALAALAYQTGDLVYGYDRLLAGVLTLMTLFQYLFRGLNILKESNARLL